MKLPNGDRVEIPIAKLVDYCLNPDHKVGSNKARVFKRVLDIDTANAESLRELLANVARDEEVTSTRVTPEGTVYVIDTALPDTRARLRSVWIIERNAEWPRLVTCYIRTR